MYGVRGGSAVGVADGVIPRAVGVEVAVGAGPQALRTSANSRPAGITQLNRAACPGVGVGVSGVIACSLASKIYAASPKCALSSATTDSSSFLNSG